MIAKMMSIFFMASPLKEFVVTFYPCTKTLKNYANGYPIR
jgi:hypothetical protein